MLPTLVSANRTIEKHAAGVNKRSRAVQALSDRVVRSPCRLTRKLHKHHMFLPLRRPSTVTHGSLVRSQTIDQRIQLVRAFIINNYTPAATAPWPNGDAHPERIRQIPFKPG